MGAGGSPQDARPDAGAFWVELVGELDGEGLDERGLVDQLEAMERLTSAAAAAKARLTADLHARRVRREARAGARPARDAGRARAR